VRALRDIRIGPAGWSYADWRGRVYPEGAGSKFDTLALVAKYFDTAEINSSFYRPPSPATARSWLKRIAHNPNFVFTAKLFRPFTHERGKATREDEKAFHEGIVNSEFTAIPNVGHLPHLEVPEECAKLMLAFLRKHAG